MTSISAHLPLEGKKLGDFDSVLSGRPGLHLILGGDFNVSLYVLTDYHHVGESIPTRDSFAHCCGRTGHDGDEHLDGRRLRTRVIHTFQLLGSRRIVDTSGIHYDFKKVGNETRASAGLRMAQDRSQDGACRSFTDCENEMYGEKRTILRGWTPADSWQKVAAETLTDWNNWNVMALLLLGTAKSHRKLETKEMSVTDFELKSLLLRKKRDGWQLGGTQLNWLCRAIWRKRRKRIPNQFSQSSRKTSVQSLWTKKMSPIPRDSTE